MKKILLVLYLFPPSNDVGSFRPVKFIKNLNQFGWHPVILAPSDGVYSSYDSKLEDEIKDKCTIYRSPLFFPFSFLRRIKFLKADPLHKFLWRIWNRLAMPDGAVSWIPSAVLLGSKIVKKENINIIFASGQPFSTFIIASLIKERTKKKVVLDYRDPWTLNPFYQGSRIRRRLERQLEKSILRRMDAAVFTTDEMREFQSKGFRRVIDPHKLFTITNSFEEFNTNHVSDDKSDNFVIIHAGNLYGNRNPEVFLQGLSMAVSRNQVFATKTKVIFYGVFDSKRFETLSHKLNVSSFVSFYPKVPQSELFPILQRASVLLLINSYGPGHHVFIPAKFFDYLKIRKPILCLSQNGALKEIINRTHTGVTVNPKDPKEVGRELLKLYHQVYIRKEPFSINENNAMKYESLYTTKELGSICNILCNTW